jgi:hypothetical protein
MRYGRTPDSDERILLMMRAAMIPITAVSALVSFLIQHIWIENTLN